MERLRSQPGAEKGRAGRGSGGDTCAAEQGGEASGWLWENKIKAVPGGENEEGKGRWPSLLPVVERQSLCSRLGG